MTGKAALVLLLALCLCHFSTAKDHVPVLIWNTNQAQGGVPSVSALQQITYASFQAKYLSAFNPNNILLFLQDALSVEDLTSHTSELRHIKGWMENGHSLFLPNVEDASHLIHDLPAHGYNVMKLNHDAGLSLKQQDKNLVVVELPSTQTNPSRRRALQKADEVMENVISKIGNQRDFTIIFTGKKPSLDERKDDRRRISRSLKADSGDRIPGWHPTNCIKMYLRQNLTLNFYKSGVVTSFEIPESKAKNDTSNCDLDTPTLLSKYAAVDIDNTTYAKLQIEYSFIKERGPSWRLVNASLHFIGVVDFTALFELQTDMDQVPFGMSFACSEPFNFVLATNSSILDYDKAEMVMQRFQVEAFQKDNPGFDPAWDCVGFFTVPIWCGLFATFIMVIILTMGLFMLSEIKTMDRFDDPKGQPIAVPSTE